MNTDQLDGLVVLKLVAEKRNFTQAAQALNLSPSAVSQAINKLESRLGIALLSRTTRSVTLTEAGTRFLNQAGPAIEQIFLAIGDVGKFAEKPSGLLRINCPRGIYLSFLSPLIASFQKKYPDITLELYFEDGVSDIVENGFDAGIRVSDILAKDMVAVKLVGPIYFVVSASPKYLKKAGYPKHPKDILQHNCILIRFNHDRMYDKWEFEHRGSEFHVQPKGHLIMNDPILIRQAAVDGMGLMYSNRELVAPLAKSGHLEIVLESYAATSTGFYLYYPSKTQVLPKLRAFIDHVKSHIAQKR